MHLDDRLSRHLYRYDRTLPLLPTSEPEPLLDTQTFAPIADVTGERVTFGSTHDERVLGSLTRPAEGDPFPAVIVQHGSTPLGRHTWRQRRPDVDVPLLWARSGFAVLVVDAYGFGSRELPDDRGRLRTTRPDLIFRTRDQRMQAVQDLMRAADYLQSRDDVRADAIGFMGVSMGTRLGVPFVGLDDRVRAGAFFVGGDGPYARFEVDGTPFEDLREDEELVRELTGPARFAQMTAGRPMYMANGLRDEVVGTEAAEILQAALGEPKTLRWFDGGHGETPAELFEEARAFLAEHLGA